MQTLTITLSDEDAAIVAREAAAQGKTPSEYAHDLVTTEAGLSWIYRTRRNESARFDAEITQPGYAFTTLVAPATGAPEPA